MKGWSPEERQEHEKKLETFYRYRRLKNTIDRDNGHEPGSWICSRCFSVNAPGVRICEGLYGPLGGDPKNIDTSLVMPCNGNLVATWGGYVNIDERAETPEAFIYKSSHPLTRGAFRRGRDSQRRWAKMPLTAEEEEGHTPEDAERASTVRKVLTARTTLRASRIRARDRNRASQEAHLDPYSWICPHCQVGDDEPRDTYNDHRRLSCYACSRPRPPADDDKCWRWFCNNCFYLNFHHYIEDADENRIGSVSLPGHISVCPRCSEVCSWDSNEHHFWYTPEQIPAAVDDETTPPVRPKPRHRGSRGKRTAAKKTEPERKRQAFSQMDEARPVPQSGSPATGASTTAPKAVAAASPPVSKAVAATLLGGAVV